MMNKKGSMFAAVMVALIIFIVGMIVTNFIMPEVSAARLSLNCDSAATITDGTKLMCLVVDTTVIYWIVIVLSLAGGLITDKVLV